MSIPKKYLNEKLILIEARIDNMSILRILTQNKQINKDDPNYNYYVQLANWANSRQEKTGTIDLNTIDLSDRSLVQKGKLANKAKHLGATLERLKNLMDQEGKYNPSSELSNLIQKTTLEILAGLSKIKNPKPEEPENSNKLYAGMDWTAERARRLENTNGKSTSEILDQFYNDYYKIEYAGLKSSTEEDTSGIVAKLKSLDSILIQEFTKLGYNPAVNPLAQFLKNLIKLKEVRKENNIFDKLTTNTYGAIHNSFIKKHVTGNMLGKMDESSDKNILFCSDLYNYKGLDIVSYLSLQKKILNKARANSDYSNDPWLLVTKILIRQDQHGDTYAEKVDSLLKVTEVIPPSNSSARLRSIPEIDELYRYIFNETVDADDSEENGEESDLKEIVKRAKRRQVVLNMIRFVIDQPDFKNKYPKQATTYADWLEEIRFKRDNDKISESQKILADGFEISIEGKLKLVKKLIATYNASKKAKANK